MKRASLAGVSASMVVALVLLVTVVSVGLVRAGTVETYIILYRAHAIPSDAASVIANAGGMLVASYNDIGVAIARSNSRSFSTSMLQDRRVEGAAATTKFATRLNRAVEKGEDSVVPAISTPAP